MRLWIMRDERSCGHDGTMLWQSNDPPVSTLGIWVFAKDDGTYLGSIEYDQKPGTCTELFTEREVRNLVEMAVFDMAHTLLWRAYFAEPSDDNWSRLMAEVNTSKGDTI